MPISRPGAPPPGLRQRRYSFAVEYYQIFSWSHRIVLTALGWVFPDPLSVSAAQLRRARLAPHPADPAPRRWGRRELPPGPVVRGRQVSGPLGRGRLVGRHPTSGAPLVAWDTEAYPAMCEAFDAENGHRIAAHSDLASRYGLTSETCADRALRTDRAIRLTLLLGTVLPGLATLIIGKGAAAALAMTALTASMTALGLLALVAASFLLFTPVAAASAMIAGARAARLGSTADTADEASRSSAAEVVEKLKGPPPQEQPQRLR